MTKRTTCPDCELEGKYKQNVGVYEDGLYCFRCEKMINTDVTVSLPEPRQPLLEGLPVPNGLQSRRISKDVTDVFKVTYLGDKLIFPYYKSGILSMQKTKTTDKKYSIINYSADVDMFGSNLHDSSRKNIIITEGEEDAMAIYQSLCNGASRSLNHITSLHRGAGSAAEFVKQHYQVLVQYDYITLCFDSDEAGQKALEKVIPLFSKNKIKIVKLPRKDACEMLINHQQEELKWAVLKADTLKPKGMLRVGDLSPDYFDFEAPPGIPTQFPGLNHFLKGIPRGQVTMVAAGTGMGKSVFVTNLAYNMILEHGLKVAHIALEEKQRIVINNYAAIYFNDLRFRFTPKALTQEQRVEYIDKFKNLYTHDHFGSLDAKELIEILEYYALSEKVDFIILDHISMAVSGNVSGKDGERKDIDILMTKLRELIHRTEVGCVCVSHLSNKEKWEEGIRVGRGALRGSGTLMQIPDNIIAIEGNLIDADTSHLRNIRLIKTRYGVGQEKICDSFEYDNNTGKIHLANTEEPF